jgi:cytochrome c-type biogenesis protein CcmH/NrfG
MRQSQPRRLSRTPRPNAAVAGTQAVDACDDAIRWNPRDPALLVAMGDAQMRAKRAADAARAYRRAAALAPDIRASNRKSAMPKN